MDGYEDIGIAAVGSFTDFIQAVGLKQFRFYTCRVQITFDSFADSQRYITFAKACFFIDSARVRIPARRMAWIQKYFHFFSSPFVWVADFTVPPM